MCSMMTKFDLVCVGCHLPRTCTTYLLLVCVLLVFGVRMPRYFGCTVSFFFLQTPNNMSEHTAEYPMEQDDGNVGTCAV